MRIFLAFIICVTVVSCHQQAADKQEALVPYQQDTSTVVPDFFPVTAYLKGQLFDIKEKGINPLQYNTIKGKTDSVWLQLDDLEKVVAPFLKPEIDSVNMKPFFKETSFLDQTINAFTYTYDPKGVLPDSLPLLHWDVYVDAEESKVSRIYMLKKEGAFTLQLTWVAAKYCKMVWIKENQNNPVVEKEVVIKWDF